MSSPLPVEVPPSDVLWRLLTDGYSFRYVSSLPDGDRDKQALMEIARLRWELIRSQAGF